MNRTPIKSSNIVSAGYDSFNQILEIEFKSGVYQYQLVGPEVAEELFKAESAGKYFMAEIRLKYNGVKVTLNE